MDTNILDATALLSDPASLALLYYLRRVDASLGLAEIVRTEWREHFIKKFSSELSRARSALDWLDRTTELGVEISPIDEAQFARAAFDRRLDEIGDLLLAMPIDDAHWRQAGEMVIRKSAPTKPGSQQFKDSLLWRAVFDTGQAHKVVLVTADSGFLSPDGVRLHDELAEETRQHESDVAIVTDFLDLLEGLRDASGSEVGDVDEDLEILEEEFRTAINALLEPDGLISRGEVRRKSIEPFATPDPDVVAVLLRAEYELGVLDDPEFVFGEEATVEASGSGLIELVQGPDNSRTVSVDYMETIRSTPHGDLVRDWDFGSPEGLPGPRRISSLIAADIRSTVERLRRSRSKRGV